MPKDRSTVGNYIAIRQGRNGPKICSSWDEALPEIDGVRSFFKTFESKVDAECFLRASSPEALRFTPYPFIAKEPSSDGLKPLSQSRFAFPASSSSTKPPTSSPKAKPVPSSSKKEAEVIEISSDIEEASPIKIRPPVKRPPPSAKPVLQQSSYQAALTDVKPNISGKAIIKHEVFLSPSEDEKLDFPDVDEKLEFLPDEDEEAAAMEMDPPEEVIKQMYEEYLNEHEFQVGLHLSSPHSLTGCCKIPIPSTSNAQLLPRFAPVVLSPEQEEILRLIMSGENVFFTGSAGTGKSVLMREAIRQLKGKHPAGVYTTASTGMAASNLGAGASTLHSFAGLGLMKEKKEDLFGKLLGMKQDYAKKRWVGAKVLIM
jgi:hypothetical protein